VSWYQKGKTNLDFTEARESEWQWHQLGHMQVSTSPQTDNHASTPPPVFYRSDALPATQPTAKALKAIVQSSTTNPQQIKVMELDGYSQPMCNKLCVSSHNALNHHKSNPQAQSWSFFHNINHTIHHKLLIFSLCPKQWTHDDSIYCASIALHGKN